MVATVLGIKKVLLFNFADFNIHCCYISVSQISFDIVVHVIIGALNLLAIKRLFGKQNERCASIRNEHVHGWYDRIRSWVCIDKRVVTNVSFQTVIRVLLAIFVIVILSLVFWIMQKEDAQKWEVYLAIGVLSILLLLLLLLRAAEAHSKRMAKTTIVLFVCFKRLLFS